MIAVVKMSLEELDKIKEKEYQRGIADSATHTLTTHRYWGAKVMTNDETVRLISETLIKERRLKKELQERKDQLEQEYNLSNLKLYKRKNCWVFWK
jgi:hypothetical protein